MDGPIAMVELDTTGGELIHAVLYTKLTGPDALGGGSRSLVCQGHRFGCDRVSSARAGNRHRCKTTEP